MPKSHSLAFQRSVSIRILSGLRSWCTMSGLLLCKKLRPRATSTSSVMTRLLPWGHRSARDFFGDISSAFSRDTSIFSIRIKGGGPLENAQVSTI